MNSSETLPRFFTVLQILSFATVQSALFLVDFMDGGFGPLKGLGFIVLSTILFGLASGLTSRRIGLAFGVFLSTPLLGGLMTYLVLISPTLLGVAGGEVISYVENLFAAQLVLYVVSFGPGFVATLLGSAMKGFIGLPED